VQHLYTLDVNEVEKRVDTLGTNVLSFVGDNSIIVYQDGFYSLIYIDLENNIEKILTAQQNTIFGASIWGATSYVSDYSGFLCGASIWKYDLTTGLKSSAKQSVGMHDYLIQDIWQDWLVYLNCDEGGGTGDRTYCCFNGGTADVYIMYIPTGETWNISNNQYGQWWARIWDHLVVWRDSRNPEINEQHIYMRDDLYGIDLCLHPELKTRFPSCLNAEKNNAQ
jgi:hypothetical protein